MDERIKFIIAIALFMTGTSLVLQAFTSLSLLWLLIPGIILIGFAYPWGHVIWARLRSGYKYKTDEEIIAQAQSEERNRHGR